MNIAAILEEARARIIDPAQWCQKAPYRDAAGRTLRPNAPPETIAQSCLVSAIKDAARPETKLDDVLDEVRLTLFGLPEMQDYLKRSGIERSRDIPVVTWHDWYATHADVIAVLDETIARLRAQQDEPA